MGEERNELMIEFRKETSPYDEGKPGVQGVAVFFADRSVEAAINEAREKYNLSEHDWNVVRVEVPR